MRLRVCIFTRETALHWAAYYVSAFRQVCDTIAIGPACTPEDFADFAQWDYVAPSVVKNDIISDETDALALLSQLPPGWNPDLVVTIQSGAPLIEGIAQVGCPTVYLSIDTWHDVREFVVARHYNVVFIAQRALVKFMRLAGCRHVFWLPLGCDPAAHYAIPSEATTDLVFVGRYQFFANRQRVARIQVLERHFKVAVYNGLNAEDMARAYGTARIIFNASIARDVNMRVFEALAAGKPLLTNREAEANGLFELFEDGKHLITYDDSDLVTQVQRCLADPEWASAIGKAGRREVLERHTYVHRVESLQNTLTALLPELGHRVYPIQAGAARVADFLPPGTQRVLDIGLALDASRIALHRKGIVLVAGVAPDSVAMERKARSYDAIALLGADLVEVGVDYDAVLWNQPTHLGFDWTEVFAKSTEWLVEGGCLLLLAGPEALEALADDPSFFNVEDWLANHGYVLLLQRIDVTGRLPTVILARSQRASVQEVADRLYQEFPTNGAVPSDGGPAINDTVPDSPDAGRP